MLSVVLYLAIGLALGLLYLFFRAAPNIKLRQKEMKMWYEPEWRLNQKLDDIKAGHYLFFFCIFFSYPFVISSYIMFGVLLIIGWLFKQFEKVTRISE